MLRPFFSRGFGGTRVVERDLYCGMLIKPALNQYNWQKTFIQSLTPYVLITISQCFETRRRPLDHREEFRRRAFTTATAIMSVMNYVFVILFHVFNKRWFLSMRKIKWQSFACKGQFNKSGNFSMIEIRENLTLSKKSQREVKFKDHVFFSTFIVS